jgi:hypothetical protein
MMELEECRKAHGDSLCPDQGVRFSTRGFETVRMSVHREPPGGGAQAAHAPAPMFAAAPRAIPGTSAAALPDHAAGCASRGAGDPIVEETMDMADDR